MTDAALLKRQRLEIEALQKKLQGSRSEVLEQEILKLRNDMLKYELEREKLSLELEEERKLQVERDRCIKEQQLKIDNLSSLVTATDSDRSVTEENFQGSLKKERSDSHDVCGENAFSTPCFKSVQNDFVVRRSKYSRQAVYSPLPDAFTDFADEDTWMKMNKGYIADLDSLHMTPATNAQPSQLTDGWKLEDYKEEILNLRRQLTLVTEERDILKINHAEEEALNIQLMEEVSGLHKEAYVMEGIPHKLSESVGSCKDLYNDVLLLLQTFVADDQSATAKLLSSTREIGSCLFSTLQSHFSKSLDSPKNSSGDDSSLKEKSETLRQRLNGIISSLVLSDTPSLVGEHLQKTQYNQVHNLGREIATWRKKIDDEIEGIKRKYTSLEEDMNMTRQQLEASKNEFHSLECKFNVLKEERDALLLKFSDTSQSLALVTDQKEKAIQNWKTEAQRRRDLEQEITKFSKAFAGRQRSVMSFNTDFQAIFESFNAQNPVPVSKPLGY